MSKLTANLRYNGLMASVKFPLDDKGLYHVVADEEDLPLLKQHIWYVRQTIANGETIQVDIYANVPVITGKRKAVKRLSLHRRIANAVPGQVVDHINGDWFDVRRSNLRICTYRENAFNRRAYRGAASRFKGVSYYARTGKWRVRIMVDGHSKFIGSFSDEVEAAKAYDIAAREAHGEYARLNFPEDVFHEQV